MRYYYRRILAVLLALALAVPMGTAASYAWNYGIELSETGTYMFPDRNVGYGSVTARSVTIWNNENQSTGRLSISLFGRDADRFTLSRETISNIERNGSATFTVAPVNGLREDIYHATVEVSGSGGLFASFDVEFAVGRSSQQGQSYGIRLSQTGTYNFPELDVGYSQVYARSVTVTNDRNQATGTLNVNLYGRDANSFTLSTNRINNLPRRNDSDSFTVRPVTGLAFGRYSATVEVSGNDGIFAAFDVEFVVTEGGRRPPAANRWQDPEFYFTPGSTFLSGSQAPFMFVARRDFQRFRSVAVNGATLMDNQHYVARSMFGFTEITFSNNYLNTLNPGMYTLDVRFSDRTVTAAFTVVQTGASSSGGQWSAATQVTPQPAVRTQSVPLVTQGDVLDALYHMAGSPGMTSGNGQTLHGRDAASAWAVSRGVLPLSGSFSFDRQVTRQDVAFLLFTLADVQRWTYPAVRGAHTFIDESSIDQRAREAVSELYKARVFNGRTTAIFDPLGSMTYTELAIVMERYVGAIRG